MSLTDKKIKDAYKDLLQLENNNNGLNATKTIKDGAGVSSCVGLGTSQVIIAPASNSSNNFQVADASGNVLLKVNGTASSVTGGVTQSILNTQYLRFLDNDIDIDNGTHIGVHLAGMRANASVTFGTSANPAAPSVNNNGDDWIHYLHYVDTNITVDAVTILVGATAATGDSINFHLCNLATGDSGTVDEWSGTTIVADQSSVTVNAGYEQFYRIDLDIQSADVDAGNYLALTIEGNGTNSDYSVNALVRYHIR